MNADALDYPHVTQVIKSAGLIDTSFFTEADRDRGTAVHAACQYLDERTLDRESLVPGVALRLAQYERFLAEMKPEILAIEEKVVNEEVRYQGRLDRRVRINGRAGVLDLKGPSCEPWIGIQLAAYAHAVRGGQARWSLHLHDDKYRLIEWTERSDWECFRAALVIHHWKEMTA